MVATAELVFFAIQSAIRLAKVGRTIYVEETIRGELGFPLPMTFSSLPGDARAYATQLELSTDPADNAIFEREFRDYIAEQDQNTASSLVGAYIKQIKLGRATPANQAARELAGAMMIRQWDSQTDPLPSPLQRVGGTLVGIAVDYALQVPGVINEDSRYGKTLKALLVALDTVNIDQTIATERWDSIIVTLFTAGLDTLKDHPELFTQDDDTANILQTAMSGVAADLAERLKTLEGPDVFDAEDRLKRFGAVVLRSVLSGTSRALIENPEVLGIEGEPEQALATKVGGAFLDLLLGGDDVPLDLSKGLRRIASTDGLDRLIKAAMQAAAAHPDLIKTGKTGIDQWLRQMIVDLYELYPENTTLFDPELLANVAYLALHHGIDDLRGLLLKNVSSGSKSLIVEVATQTLNVLVTQPSGNKPAKWRFDLSRGDIEQVVAGTLTALADHPEWVFAKPSHRKIAAAVLPLAVEFTAELGQGKDGAWFKSLVRSGRLELVLAAILTSGTFESLKDEEGKYPAAKTIAAVVNTALKAILREGVGGLGNLLTYEVMHDVMLALVNSGLLDNLVKNNDAAAGRARLLTLVGKLRKQEQITVSEMVKILNAA